MVRLKERVEKYRALSRDIRAKGFTVVDLGDRDQTLRSTQIAFLLDEFADTLELLIKQMYKERD